MSCRLTLDEQSCYDGGLSLVVDEAEVVPRVGGQHGRHLQAEVRRGEVHALGGAEDHGALVVVGDQLGAAAAAADRLHRGGDVGPGERRLTVGASAPPAEPLEARHLEAVGGRPDLWAGQRRVRAGRAEERLHRDGVAGV